MNLFGKKKEWDQYSSMIGDIDRGVIKRLVVVLGLDECVQKREWDEAMAIISV